jgi:hypothetical protein
MPVLVYVLPLEDDPPEGPPPLDGGWENGGFTISTPRTMSPCSYTPTSPSYRYVDFLSLCESNPILCRRKHRSDMCEVFFMALRYSFVYSDL